MYRICFKELSMLLIIMLKYQSLTNKRPETDLTLLSVPDLANILPLRFSGTLTFANEPLTPRREKDEK